MENNKSSNRSCISYLLVLMIALQLVMLSASITIVFNRDRRSQLNDEATMERQVAIEYMEDTDVNTN